MGYGLFFHKNGAFRRSSPPLRHFPFYFGLGKPHFLVIRRLLLLTQESADTQEQSPVLNLMEPLFYDCCKRSLTLVVQGQKYDLPE